MSCLAISDNVMLCISANYWFATTGFPRPRYQWECKLIAYLFNSFSSYGIILVIIMTIDRMIVVRFPLKAATICTSRRAKVASIVTLLVTSVLRSPNVYFSNLLDGRSCVDTSSKNPINLFYSRTIFVLFSVVPFMTILTLNVIIIYTLKQRSVNFNRENWEKEEEASSKPEQRIRSAKDTQLVIMLLTVTFALLILTAPKNLHYVIFLLVDYKQDAQIYAVFNLLYQVTVLMYYTNSAVNFYLYCLSGSKFRQEAWQLLSCKK